ncbi:hypothetical protein LF817_17280 [Halobacillus sp. A1]|uniref:TolB family protein n=1 Tax=Halobacillus sp. A1 TaxID=2880262 RepID=UPI0020A68ACD|nr:hypothetical protein [Halobacillus sp. A1]MCP3033080.1 hypothetical protein [Halobacillus sp. A1]
MSLKMKNILFLSIVVAASTLLYWTGTFAEGPKGREGLDGSPALSNDGEEIAFPHYEDGEATLYTAAADGGEAEQLLERETRQSFVRPAYSPDNSKLLYIKEWRVEGKPYSQLMMYDFDKQQSQPLKDQDHYIREAIFSPDGKSIYLVKADGYVDQPDGDGVIPDGYDVYQMNRSTYETEQLTNEGNYNLSSLSTSKKGDHLVYSLYNGEDLIQQLNVNNKKIKTIMPEPGYESGAGEAPIINSPSNAPDGETIAFSDVAHSRDNGTFQYEVFTMTTEGEDVVQVTNFHEHVSEPVFYPDGNDLLVSVDRNFAGRDPDYEYWKVSGDGKERKEIIVEIPE